MHVSALYVYPVKGAAGIRLDTAELDPFGIRWDRRWMAVDMRGRFITAREHPRLLQLEAAFAADDLVLRSPAAGELRLPLTAAREQAADTRVTVWRDVVDAHDEGAAAAGFVSTHLGFDARLVFMPPATVRQVDPAYARAGDRVGFADAFPLLLIGQASLDELNRRLDEPVPMLRFRPNVVVTGAAPHAEDGWCRIRFGDVACDVVKPCARCVVTTLDPATLAASREPLRTLAQYRSRAGKVMFGQNVIHRAVGRVAVGDQVEVAAATASTSTRSSGERPSGI